MAREMLPGAGGTVKPQVPRRGAVHPVVMLRLRSISCVPIALGALVLVVACEVRVGDPAAAVTTGAGAGDATSGAGATRPVGGSSGDQGGDPTQTEAVITVGRGIPQGQGGAGGSGGAATGSGGDPGYQCQTNGVCDIHDDCVCPDCQNRYVCTDPSYCKNDGMCRPFTEGCQCQDCASLDICSP